MIIQSISPASQAEPDPLWLETIIHSRYVKGRDATTEDGQSYRNGRTAYCKRSGYLYLQPFIPFRKWLRYDGQVSEGAKPLVPVLCHPMPSIQKHRWAQQIHLISYPSGSPLVCLPGQALPRQHHGQDRADQQVKKAPHRSLTPGAPLTTPTAGGRRWKRPSRWCFGTLGPLWTSSTSPNEEKTTYIASWNMKYTHSGEKPTSQHEINRIDC